MHNRTNVIYTYDGTFEGLLCCVFESYKRKEIPLYIHTREDPQYPLLEEIWIDTIKEKHERVYHSFLNKFSDPIIEFIKDCFLTCLENKEILMLQFIRLTYQHGNRILNMLTDDTVNTLTKAVRFLQMESHKLKGFVRFTEHNSVLTSVIEPKNYVLPLMSPHFCNRFHNENFMIYDETHHVALVHSREKEGIVPIDEFVLPDTSEEELQIQDLWKNFYNAIAIKERFNPKCQMSLVPKRYWKNIIELENNL